MTKTKKKCKHLRPQQDSNTWPQCSSSQIQGMSQITWPLLWAVKTLKWLFSKRYPYQNSVNIPCLLHANCTDHHIIILGISVLKLPDLYKSQSTLFSSIINFSFLHTFRFMYLPECLVSKHMHYLFLDFIQLCHVKFEKLHGETLPLHRKISSHTLIAA